MDLPPKIRANSVSSANRWQMKYLSSVDTATGRASPNRNLLQHFFLRSPWSLRPFLFRFGQDLGLLQKSESFCVHLLCPDAKGMNIPLWAHQTTGSPLFLSWLCVQFVWTNFESAVSYRENKQSYSAKRKKKEHQRNQEECHFSQNK